MQMSSPDLNHIRSLLGDGTWTVEVFDEVSSTNTLLKELGRRGAPAGTVLVADRQTGGRGRLGRSFLSPGGVGVYLSALIRPDCAPTELMHLTCAVAVAVCDAVEDTFGFRPGIKWTNDLVVGTKKLGGILTELGLDPKTGREDFAVLGIGINCGQLEEDFDESIRPIATSVRMVTGRQADRDRFIARMVKALEAMDRELLRAPAPCWTATAQTASPWAGRSASSQATLSATPPLWISMPRAAWWSAMAPAKLAPSPPERSASGVCTAICKIIVAFDTEIGYTNHVY